MPEIREKYKPQINTVLIIKNHTQSALSAFLYYTTFLPELRWQAGNIQLPMAVGSVQFSSLRGRRTKPGQPHQAGHPEKIILSGLTKAGYTLFLPLTQICRFFSITHIFNIMPFYLPPPPHPISARYGKNQQKMATLYRSKWAWSKVNTPNPCFVYKSVQKLPFSVQKCATQRRQ